MADLENLLLQEKPCSILITLREEGETYVNDLTRKTDTTYSHGVKILQKFEEEGIATSVSRGRRKDYKLTEKGCEISDALIELHEQLESEKSTEGNRLQDVKL